MRHKVKNHVSIALTVILLAMSVLSGSVGTVLASVKKDAIDVQNMERIGNTETETEQEKSIRSLSSELGNQENPERLETEAGEEENSGSMESEMGQSENFGDSETEDGEESETGDSETEDGEEDENGNPETEIGEEKSDPPKMETVEENKNGDMETETGESKGENSDTETEEDKTGNSVTETGQEESGTDSGEEQSGELETGTEAETEPQTEIEEETEHFLKAADGMEQFFESDFASMRLVILASNADTVVDPEHIIANYSNIYLLQYGSVEQTMNAYAYYIENADAVEPDTVVEMASEGLSDKDIAIDITEEQNPISALSSETDSAAAQRTNQVIALIDTGASACTNVIDCVSLIDDVPEGGNSHANDMAAAIVEQNPDAKILSVRALGDDGRGTVSSVVAAIEYAMNQKVGIINLSLYAKTNLLNSVLETEIQKAVSAGIAVVGSAGNDGADAAGYVPGSVRSAYIIGACDENGVRLENSNYGETVDYNVVAGSTSEAAAKFSGYVSAHGIEAVAAVLDSGLIYRTDYEITEKETEAESENPMLPVLDRTPVIYVSDNADCTITLLGEKFLAGNTIHFTVEPVTGMEIAGVSITEVSSNTSSLDEISLEDDLSTLFLMGEAIEYEIVSFTEEGIVELAFLMPNQDVMIEAAVQPEGNGISAAAEDLLDDISSGKFTGWGDWCRCPASYGDSNYGTTKKSMIVYDSDGNQVKYLEETGYCIQSSKNTPDINATGKANILTSADEQALAKALFYLRGGPGFSRTFTGADGVKYNFKNDFFTTASDGSTLTAKEQYYMSHVTISYLWYLYCEEKGYDTASWNWNAGVTQDLMNTKRNVLNAEGKAFVKKVVNALKQMTFPTCKVSKTTFVKSDITLDTATGKFKTPVITYTAIYENSMSFTLPADVNIVITASSNASRVGLTYSSGQTATINGGEKFQFEVPAGKVTGNKTYSGNVKIAGDFAGYSFKYSGDHQDLAFGFSNGNNTFTFQIDWPECGFVKIKKTDGNGGWNSKLAGAQFSLYSGSSCLETVTINGSGYVNFDTALLLGTTYTIKETKTPAGFIKAADILVKPTEAKTYSYDVANIKAPTVLVKKTSTAGSELLGLSSYSVEGAEFGIYTEQACTNKIGTLKTAANGQTGTFTLPCSSPTGTYTYYVREDKAPAGHTKNSAVKSFQVTLPADDGAVKTVEFSNNPAFIQVNALIEKLDMKGNPVKEKVNGAVIFAAKFYDSDHADTGKLVKTWYLSSDEDGKVYLDEKHKVKNRPEYVSDAFYTWNDGIVIPGGYLTIQEVEAPPEYIMDTAIQGWNTTAQTISVKQIYNELKPCKISIRKFDADGTTPLAGVEFELSFQKASVSDTSLKKNYTRLLKEGETITYTTNPNGEVVFDNLDQGDYLITEVKTVGGRSLLEKPIEVTLPLSMTQEEADAWGNVDTAKGELFGGVYHFMEVKYNVTNTADFTPPMTGSTGDWMPGYIGMAAVIGLGGTVYGFRRRPKKIKY